MPCISDLFAACILSHPTNSLPAGHAMLGGGTVWPFTNSLQATGIILSDQPKGMGIRGISPRAAPTFTRWCNKVLHSTLALGSYTRATYSTHHTSNQRGHLSLTPHIQNLNPQGGTRWLLQSSPGEGWRPWPSLWGGGQRKAGRISKCVAYSKQAYYASCIVRSLHSQLAVV